MTTMINRRRMRDRARHIDLLDQVADSTEERDNVRRILGAVSHGDADLAERPALRGITRENRLTEADLDAAQRWREQPLPGRTSPRGGDLLRVAALFLAAWAVIATLLLVTGVRL